jgi:hypothetical protein
MSTNSAPAQERRCENCAASFPRSCVGTQHLAALRPDLRRGASSWSAPAQERRCENCAPSFPRSCVGTQHLAALRPDLRRGASSWSAPTQERRCENCAPSFPRSCVGTQHLAALRPDLRRGASCVGTQHLAALRPDLRRGASSWSAPTQERRCALPRSHAPAWERLLAALRPDLRTALPRSHAPAWERLLAALRPDLRREELCPGSTGSMWSGVTAQQLSAGLIVGLGLCYLTSISPKRISSCGAPPSIARVARRVPVAGSYIPTVSW